MASQRVHFRFITTTAFFFFIANRCQSTSKYDHLLTDPYCIYRVWSCGALSIHTCSITCSDTKKASHPGPGHTVERQTSIHTRSHLQITNSECIRSTFFFFGPISGWRSEGRVFKEYDSRLVGNTGEPGGFESSDPRVHVYVRAGAP